VLKNLRLKRTKIGSVPRVLSTSITKWEFGTAPLRPALDYCVGYRPRKPRAAPAHWSAIASPEGRGLNSDPGLACPSSPTARPARSRRPDRLLADEAEPGLPPQPRLKLNLAWPGMLLCATNSSQPQEHLAHDAR